MTDFERLREIRERLKFKQGDFAALIGLQQGSYSDVERGKANITYNLLGKLYELFKINPIFIMLGEGNWILDNSNNLDKILNIDKNLDKSNKTENGDDNKNDNKHDNKEYILEDNQGAYRVEEEAVQSHKIIKQSDNIAQNQGLSPPEAEILKERIQSLREILKSKEEVLKAKDEQILLLRDKVHTLQYQVNNLLKDGEHNIRDAA